MNNDLLVRLRKRYSDPVIPKCRVCGGELSLGMMGHGRAEWYCRNSEDGDFLVHYNQSQYIQTQFGDDDVLSACDEIERLRSLIMRWAAPRGSHRTCECSYCQQLTEVAENLQESEVKHGD